MAIATINPATGTTVRTFPELTEAEVEQKIGVAHERWQTYRGTGFDERAECMRAASDLFEKEVDRAAQLMSTKMGKTLASARGEALKCAHGMRYIVHADIYDAFTEQFVSRMRGLKVGDPFDTADAYGPLVAEPLLRRALYPYDEHIVIGTKAGFTRQGPDLWTPVGRPAYLRQECEMSLRNLGVDRIALFQLHRVDPEVPLEDQVGELKALKDEGKIAHMGLSEVTVDEIEQARAVAPIASVQNLYNLANRAAEDVLNYCERHQIAFIPWFPLATGGLVKSGGPLEGIASRLSATPSQLALAWLLRRSPVVLPIPGTSSVEHLEQNVAAASVQLTDDDVAELTAAVK